MDTNHCTSRCQQRGIPHVVIDWLIKYGSVTRRNHADVYYMDKKSRKRLRSDIGKIAYKRIQDLLDSYLVLSDEGNVITVTKRYKRIRNS